MDTPAENAAPVLVPLTILSLELGETADELAARLTDAVIIADSLGRRSVPAAVARELITAEARRRYADAEAARKRQAAFQQHMRDLDAKHRVGGGVRVKLDNDTLPVVAMTAAAGAQYEGATYIPAPTHLDWMFGVEGGRMIRPTPEELAAQAAARSANRATLKKGKAPR